MSQSKQVVFIRSNEVAPDPRVEKEAKTLHSAGWRVLILGWDRSGSVEDEERDYAKIFRIRIRAPYGARFRNIPRKLRWNAALLWWLARNRKQYTHIHACDLDTAVPAVIAARLFRKKIIYDIFDNIVIDENSGLIGLVARTIKRVENWVIKRSDAVILVDECRTELLGVKPKRLIFVYNSPDTLVSAAPAEPARDGHLCITYVGQLSLERGLIEILDVIAKHPEFTLNLAGYGCNEAEIVEKASRLSNVKWHGRVDYDRALELSKQADVLFATYDPDLPLHRYSSANKLFEAMMLGKPLLVARHTGMDAIVDKYDLGPIVDYGNKDQIEKALLDLMNRDNEKRQSLAARARETYEQYYSAGIMTSRLIDLYNDLSI